MACCGEKRQQLAREAVEFRKREALKGLRQEKTLPSEPRKRSYFEYLGATGMSVYCPATNRRYHFGSQGAAVPVDPRDEAALLTIPLLRKLGY